MNPSKLYKRNVRSLFVKPPTIGKLILLTERPFISREGKYTTAWWDVASTLTKVNHTDRDPACIPTSKMQLEQKMPDFSFKFSIHLCTLFSR